MYLSTCLIMYLPVSLPTFFFPVLPSSTLLCWHQIFHISLTNIYFLSQILYLILTNINSSSQTVFGSGLLHWEEEGSSWATRIPGLKLFLAICLPMTTFTLGVWLIWNYISKRKMKKGLWRLKMAEEGLLGLEEGEEEEKKGALGGGEKGA